MSEEPFRRVDVMNFIDNATSADYRYFLRDTGFDFVTHEVAADGERIQVFGDNNSLIALGRLRRLTWDTSFFRAPTGRLEGMFFSPTDSSPITTRQHLVRELISRAEATGLKHLTCRIRSDDLFLVQALEMEGFCLTDMMTIYRQPLRAGAISTSAEWTVVGPLLEQWVHNMKWGRVFYDPNIDRRTAEKFYIETSRDYVEAGAHVTILSPSGIPVGVAIGVLDEEVSRQIGQRYGILWLIIVAPARERSGIGSLRFKQFCHEFGAHCDVLEIGTQSYNIPANRIYLKAGCVPVGHLCTFHFWSGRT